MVAQDPADEAAAVREELFFQRRYWAAQALGGIAGVCVEQALNGHEFETEDGTPCTAPAAIAMAVFNIAEAMMAEEARRK